jgi:hypothetical protein
MTGTNKDPGTRAGKKTDEQKAIHWKGPPRLQSDARRHIGDVTAFRFVSPRFYYAPYSPKATARHGFASQMNERSDALVSRRLHRGAGELGFRDFPGLLTAKENRTGSR